MVSFNKPNETLDNIFKDGIKTLFRGSKPSGFNLKDTHIAHLNRLEKLVLLVMVAFVWCYKIRDYIDRKIKPITLKKHGNRAVSIFKHGLDWNHNNF